MDYKKLVKVTDEMKSFKDFGITNKDLHSKSKKRAGSVTDKYIAVICSGKIEYWKSRKRAISFYTEGAESCEGSESYRYWDIVEALESGKMVCSDDSGSYDELKSAGKVEKFPNGTSVRDLTGEIEFPVRGYKNVTDAEVTK